MGIKYYLIGLIKAILRCFFIFKIRPKTVLFSAYSGKQYSCNPKYICEFLLKETKDELEIVWAFNDPNEFNNIDPRIKKIKFKSLKFIYYALTSRVVVDNVESWSILPRRKGQAVINTWHGGGAYKGVGLRREDTNALQDKNMINKHKRVNYYVSSSKAFTKMTLRDSFKYKGKVIECGMPRNDILIRYSQEKVNSIKRRLDLDNDTKIVIYAPTFRNSKSSNYEIDADAVLKALSDKTGKKWKMLYRSHYYVTDKNMSDNNIIDVSAYPDMQELLLISDVLITDYSSSIWDFSLMKKPAFLFANDLKEYKNERDFYTPIEEWPYPMSETMEELIQTIMDYDKEKAEIRINKHHAALKSCETGNASKIIGNMIIRKCCKGNK
ncbi:CDP-glycerol glycerophosphotransferase [Ruminococcus flavefaciens]|uniref:CDP-glycerol glycerophosphotransferase n=1 Tax=Ruminococcus flavefaciens TaxID=1265 RepID=A0A1H6KQ91_RUMFL|nr:CDP-glycerol glycerophosphotransferase family protein [Ruminococcus flavefaciens]SEH75024.1 CDP-glycerol glycerophosphotransferase [Ruminococcus flavefaciens]